MIVVSYDGSNTLRATSAEILVGDWPTGCAILLSCAKFEGTWPSYSVWIVPGTSSDSKERKILEDWAAKRAAEKTEAAA